MIAYEQPMPGSERARDWLRYIQNRGDDLRWLAPYEDHLVALIRKGIYTPREFKDTVQLLMKIVPYFVLTLFHTDGWLDCLLDALLQAQDLHHNELQVRIFNALGEVYIKSGNHKSAHGSFETALERAEEARTNATMVASYAGLFKLQWFDLTHPLMPHLVQRSLEIVQPLDDLALKANLHDSLGRAYSRLGQTQQALGHAQTAFIYWNALPDRSQLGWTAYLLVTIYRNIALQFEQPACLNHAEYFLQLAREQIGSTEYTCQVMLLAYQSGALHLQRHENEQAEERFTTALWKARIVGQKNYLALAYHGLGLAQTELKQFALSRENLEEAIKLWEELENAYEQASALQALGYLEGVDGHTALALKLLEDALSICEGLLDTLQGTRLQAHIQATIDELKD